MNYELAKKLKDAGYLFPTPIIGDEFWYLPTLSELIKACGANFRSLYLHNFKTKRQSHIDKYGEGYVWQAKPNQHYSKKPSCWGKTPEEAVAKLWIELNK